MRLHVMKVEAFGPFAAHERVDFDALTESGLFLLCGPTGAGKTSVLDAVCFALFGQVPGARDKAKRLHSDHATPGSGPRVVLEVSLRGRRLRITRCPEWMRPKKRGTGEIREHAKVLVEERLDGRWAQRTNRIDEAADLLGGLVGLTMSQFCQVALLPQGQFETFLRSGAQERHTLLERLFGTYRFRAVEDWLTDHRRAVSAASDDHARRVAAIIERVAEVSALDRPDEGPLDHAADWAADWADGLRRTVVAELTEATEERAAADQRAKAARAARDAGCDRAELQTRHRDANSRDAELRALADSTERMAARVEEARLAATVQPLVEVHDASRRRAHEAVAAVQRIEAEMPADPADTPDHDLDDVDDVTALVRRRHDEVSRLEALLPVQQRLAGLDHELEQLAGDVSDNATERTRLRTRTAEQTPLLESARHAHSEASTASAQLPQLRERLTGVQRLADAAARLPSLRQRRESLAAARESTTDTAQGARGHWLDLRQARLDGMAAELARDLGDGQPCPVCGSGEHPAPADPGAHAVSAEAEHEAEQAWQHAEQARERSAEELAACERELAATETAADGTDPDTAATRLDDAESQLNRFAQCASQVERLAAQVAAYEKTLDEAAHRDRQLEADRGSLLERQTLRARERAALRLEVAEATGDAETLTGRLEQAQGASRLAEQLLDALREHNDAARGHQRAADRLEAALADTGFADADEVRAAMMSRTDLSNAETLVRRRADQAAQTRAVLDDPRVQEAAAARAVVLEPLTEELAEAERVRDEKVTRERALERQGRRLEQLCADLGAALTGWQPVRASLAVAERMASLCAGTSADNRHKMRLSAYVLAARLEQVVAAANDRLTQMSSGRYTLEHSLARGVGDRRGGLGLQVHDGWTGDLRDPATLSGGETFYTSLALALGLADVVAHEAGGTEIDTLFVDEGFGSLDADTLDEVMDVLDQLRSGGRAVGIVSHVGDLRARVPAQVHVRKTHTGSTLAPT